MTSPHSEPGLWARFDDLVAGRSLLCPIPDRVVVTEDPAGVTGALEEVQETTDTGH